MRGKRMKELDIDAGIILNWLFKGIGRNGVDWTQLAQWRCASAALEQTFSTPLRPHRRSSCCAVRSAVETFPDEGNMSLQGKLSLK
jgi:hypothetical protein